MTSKQFIEISVDLADEDQRSLLIADLAGIGYEGFEETDQGLKAYIREEDFDEPGLNNIFSRTNVNYSKSVIKEQNWNEVWESNFEPVQVDDFVGIRASFHAPMVGVEHEIVITPKMSFGTGHHATTWLVMQQMRDLDFKGKSVFDFGTGTGVLAILAEKLGASSVLAVDNDDWCIENASENILVNGSERIEIEKLDVVNVRQQFDVVIANINRNIILENMAGMEATLAPGGELLLSGLLEQDEADIRSAAVAVNLVYLKTVQKNGWIAMRFCKKS
jgi:ribosomal protein L11 methyltransferase